MVSKRRSETSTETPTKKMKVETEAEPSSSSPTTTTAKGQHKFTTDEQTHIDELVEQNRNEKGRIKWSAVKEGYDRKFGVSQLLIKWNWENRHRTPRKRNGKKKEIKDEEHEGSE